jgi:hypothetical protein
VSISMAVLAATFDPELISTFANGLFNIQHLALRSRPPARMPAGAAPPAPPSGCRPDIRFRRFVEQKHELVWLTKS